MPTKQDVLKYLIEKGPGRSEVELAEAIYGSNGSAYQQLVNQDCRMLADRGEVERQGSDPHRYVLPVHIPSN